MRGSLDRHALAPLLQAAFGSSCGCVKAKNNCTNGGKQHSSSELQLRKRGSSSTWLASHSLEQQHPRTTTRQLNKQKRTTFWTPSDDCAVAPPRCKGPAIGADGHNLLQLTLHLGTITSIICKIRERERERERKVREGGKKSEGKRLNKGCDCYYCYYARSPG